MWLNLTTLNNLLALTMTVDEPFTWGEVLEDYSEKKLRQAVAGELNTANNVAFTLRDRAIRASLVPSDDPLDPSRYRLLRDRWRYCHERQANAQQIFAARGKLNMPKHFTLASAINIQRVFESLDFYPVRDWWYYPVIDAALGCGVPRSQAFLSSLRHAQIAIQPDRTEPPLVFDAGARSFTYLRENP